MNVWATLNPPEPEVDTGVSMQKFSSELNFILLQCASGHVRQARRCDCYEGLAVRWWCIGSTAQWLFACKTSESMDSLSMVGKDAVAILLVQIAVDRCTEVLLHQH